MKCIISSQIPDPLVLSANESSYSDPGPRLFDQGTPHPIAWYQEHGAGVENGGTAGRSFYTSLGHLNQTWQDNLFIAHVVGGISWALQSNTTRAFNPNGQVGNSGSGAGTASGQSPADSNDGGTPARPGFTTLTVCAALALSLLTTLL